METQFLVIEIQKNDQGVVSNIVTAYSDKRHAESAYYTILAAAALSNLPVHTAMVIDDMGNTYHKESYLKEITPI